MIVVTLKPNDEEQVLRGAAAEAWRANNPSIGHVHVDFKTETGRQILSGVGLTTDETLFVALAADDLTDVQARAMLDALYDHIIKSKGRRRGKR
jgi:hypothetical protein